MKLFYFETSNPRKACALAKHVEAPVEFVRVDLSKGEHKTPEYLAVNPNGKVPALQDGETCLWEADAIMCYLADKMNSPLWPKDARQIDIIRWISWATSHFSRHGGILFFERFIKPQFGLGETNPTAVEEAEGFFRQFGAVLDGYLKGRDYLVGGTLSLADFAVASPLPYAGQAALPLDDFGEIRRWYATIEALPAWRHPFPEDAASAA